MWRKGDEMVCMSQWEVVIPPPVYTYKWSDKRQEWVWYLSPMVEFEVNDPYSHTIDRPNVQCWHLYNATRKI